MKVPNENSKIKDKEPVEKKRKLEVETLKQKGHRGQSNSIET